MWLVQLHKAKEDASIGAVYVAESCERDYMANYIDPDEHTYELSLCNDWHYNNKKKLLILKKTQGTVLSTPRNERMIEYQYNIHYPPLLYYNDFIIFEYFTEPDFLMDFYINTKMRAIMQIPDGTISSDSTIIGDLIRYLNGKTLNIRVIDSDTPKYSIHFNDDCKYYAIENAMIIMIKKPFLIIIDNFNFWYESSYFNLNIYVAPKLIDEINDYGSTTSDYNPATDPPMSLDSIVSQYFDIATMSGLQQDNVNIDYPNNTFEYKLIRTIVGNVKSNAIGNYIFDIDGTILQSDSTGMYYYDWRQVPLYTYFPLLRPKLDNQNSFTPFPQYDPLNENSRVISLGIRISLSNSNSINYFLLFSTYLDANSLVSCNIEGSGQLPSWASDQCNFTVPFRFVGAADCNNPQTDHWRGNLSKNANYLFKIARLPASDTCSIKGIGCNEITQTLSFDSNFIPLFYSITVDFFESLRTVTLSGFGYSFETISNRLGNVVRLETSETCFVLFSDKLIDEENDFINIHTAVREALPNAIICYFGDDSRIPPDLTNKVIHSDAIVTDLDTNEQCHW